MKVKLLSRDRLFETPWTAAYQAPSMGFSRQEYWSGFPLLSPRFHLNIEFFFFWWLLLEKVMAPQSSPLAWKSRGQRSLVGCSPWGRKESDTTERLHFHFSLSFIGEGNSNPLQCSCLENPRDGGCLVGCRLWGRTESDTTEAT